MPRFLSRAGTNIDDLERQLARVGSGENDGTSIFNTHSENYNDDDEGNDDSDAGSDNGNTNEFDRSKHAASESTPLLSAYSLQQQLQTPHGAGLGTVSQHKHKHKHGRKHRYPGSSSSSNVLAKAPTAAAAAATSVVFSTSGTGSAARKLGTWDGVFLPVTLSIWGILVYVRMGFFLGQIGVIGTIASFVCGYL
ncbi:hypothetical protein GGI05_001641, partial [Coemansia sp. RSA 2603]